MTAKPIRITSWNLTTFGSAGKNKSKRKRKDYEEPEQYAEERSPSALGWRAEPGWTLLAVFGWMLCLVGAIELGLTIFPAESSAEFEFATAVSLVSGLPVPTMGLALVIASALKRKAKRTARVFGSIALLGSVSIVVGLVIFALTIPVARRFINDPVVILSLNKAMIKTGGQGLVYVIGLGIIGVQAWRQSKARESTLEDLPEEPGEEPVSV